MVGVTVLLAVLPLRRGGSTRALVLILVVLAGVGAVTATVVLTGQVDFVQERARFQSYDNDRFGAQKLGIEVAESKPLGIGPGQFEVLSPVSAHSTYIRAGAEQGLLGFLVVVVLLGGTLLVASEQRDHGAGHGGHRLDRPARDLVRDARQQRLHRHAALAPRLRVRRA